MALVKQIVYPISVHPNATCHASVSGVLIRDTLPVVINYTSFQDSVGIIAERRLLFYALKKTMKYGSEYDLDNFYWIDNFNQWMSNLLLITNNLVASRGSKLTELKIGILGSQNK